MIGLCLLAMVACQDGLTQTVVVVDGDGLVRSRIERLELVVEGGPNESPFVAITEQTRVLPSSGLELALPAQQPVQPLTGDASRLFRATATARLGPGDSVTGRVITGYAKGQSLVARIFLTADCVNVTCGRDETCEAGDCVSAFRPTEELPPYRTMELGTPEPADAGMVDMEPGDAARVDMASPSCVAGPMLFRAGAVETLSAAVELPSYLRLAWSEGGSIETALVDERGLSTRTTLRSSTGGGLAVGGATTAGGNFLLVTGETADTMTAQPYTGGGAPLGGSNEILDAVTLAISPLVRRADGWLLMVQNTDGEPVVIVLDTNGAEVSRSIIGPDVGTTWYRLRDTPGGLVASWRVTSTNDCVAVLLNPDGTLPPGPRRLSTAGCFDPDIASSGSGFGLVSHRRVDANREVRFLPLDGDLNPSASAITISSDSFAQNQGAHISWTGSAYRVVWTSDATGFSWALLDASGSPLNPPMTDIGTGAVGDIVSLPSAVFFLRGAGTDEGIYWIRDCPP